MEVGACARAKPQTGRGRRRMTNMTGWIHTRFLATWTNTEPFGRRNAQAIYQDLVDQHGFTASYESVKRFVRALRHVDPEQFDRLECAAGEEAQVDYGEGARIRDPSQLRDRIRCESLPSVDAERGVQLEVM